jgi:putative Mn2+ efflux pump MntP
MSSLAALNLASMFYLSFLVCLVLSLLEGLTGKALWKVIFRRWGKLLGGLVAIGIIVQILTWIA